MAAPTTLVRSEPTARPGVVARPHGRRWRDDRGFVDAVEQLYGLIFLILISLFFMEVGVWWHARNILEQAAAEGARIAAAADGSCVDGNVAAKAMAERLGGNWVRGSVPECTEGPIVGVTVTASTPMFLFPVALNVSARATAPEEG